jgi:hypothetical protein
MIDLKLTDFFSTLCIGILSLSLITYFYFLINKFFVKDKFDEDKFSGWIKEILKDNYKESGYMVIGLVLVYCLGIISGDLTGRMTDSDSSHKGWMLKILKKASDMQSQESARRDALVNPANDWNLTSLGQAVLRSSPIVKNANHIAGTTYFSDTTCSFTENWNKIHTELQGGNIDSVRSRLAFSKFLQQIYYTGKNWTFAKNDEPLNELKGIQNRIDLSRSIVLLVTLAFFFLLFIVIVNLLVAVIIAFSTKDVSKFKNWSTLFQPLALVILFVLGYLSRDCYNINEDNYNKRAYGYYVSDINRLEYLKDLKVLPQNQELSEE